MHALLDVRKLGAHASSGRAPKKIDQIDQNRLKIAKFCASGEAAQAAGPEGSARHARRF